MKWTDEGVVLAVVPFSENEARLSILTHENGRQAGLYRLSKRQPALQIGDMVLVTWNARLSEHLGRFAVERNAGLAARMFGHQWKLWLLQHACGLMAVLPERHPYPKLYACLSELLVSAAMQDDLTVLAELTIFEKFTLAQLGFGIDLSECCVNQTREQLSYISPKTGRAVSMRAIVEGEAGAYVDKLFPLPPFWLGGLHREDHHVVWHDILTAFRVTDHFWHKWLFNDKQTFPSIRKMIISYVKRKVIL